MLLLLVVLIFILVQTPPVQNFARKKIESYLEGKLKTEVSIGKLYIGFPNSVSLQNVYVEDLQKDTLLYGGRLAVDISLFKLLSSEVEINEIQLEQITAKIKRQLPDTTFNFQFIIDAFAPAKPTAANPADTAAVKMAIKSVLLNKVRLLYQDVITGNDMDVTINDLTTRIDIFDPAKMRFHIPDIQVNGIKGHIYQSKPLVSDDSPGKDLAEAKQPVVLNLTFKDINLQNIELDYRNDVSAFYNTVKLGTLQVDASNIDMPNRTIELNKLLLNNTTAQIRLGNKKEAQKVAEELKQELQAEATNDWRFRIGSLELNNNNIKFDNDASPRLSRGMDYAHLKADNLTLHARDFLFTIDTISARITKGSFQERSGFQLRRLETNFLFASKEAYLHDLVLETPGTRLGPSITLRYPSLEALAKAPETLRMDINLNNNRILVKDILAFAPQLASQPAFSNPSDTWFLDGNIEGTMANMHIQSLQFNGLSNTKVNLSGNIAGLPDINRTRVNLNIRNLSTSKTDLALFIPAGTLPQNITLPDQLSANGTINGSLQDVTTDLSLNTSLGNATVRGRIQNATSPTAVRYNVTIRARNVQVGRIMQDPTTFGPVSADLTANGRGFDPAVAQGSVKGIVHSAIIKNYNYRNFTIDGSIADKHFKAIAGIRDPNIHLSLNASGLVTDKFPSLKLEADIDSIKTQPLNLTPDVFIYRGTIRADFANTDPDDLMGQMLVTHSVIVNGNQRLQLDTLEVNAGRNDTGRYLRLTSDVARIAVAGEYKLTQLGSVVQNLVQPHFALVPAYQAVAVDPYDFTINARLLDKPLWRAFMPELKRMDNLVLRGNFSSERGWQLTAGSPLFEFGANRFVDLNLTAGSGNSGIDLKASMSQMRGPGINIYGVTVGANAANNELGFTLNIKDKAAKDKYHLSATMKQPSFGSYTFSLRPQSLLLNYDAWNVREANAISITPSGINVSNFILSRNNQQLSINSANSSVNAPINVNFSNFKLGTLTGFVQADTTFVDGLMNGNVVLSDIMKQPVFTSDLTINDLSVRKDTLGNATIRVNNRIADTYEADVRITGRGNDVALTGKYLVKPDNNSSYDFVLDVRALQLNTVEGIANGAIKDASGQLTGKVAFNGTMKDPNIDGRLTFNNAALNITMLNSKFTVDKEQLVILNNEGIRFSTFTIRDETGNAIVIDGMAGTTNFINYDFNLSVNANNFRAINSTKVDNKLFYGKLFLSSNLYIRGTEMLPVIDGSVTINKETDFTAVMPQPEPGIVEREGVVEFVDMDAPPENDSLFLQPYLALDTSAIRGFDINTNIEINKDATLSLVIDAGNGDFIRMKGEGLINAGIDRSGKITLSGSYELSEGSYELTFNFLRRKFNIQKGSKIVWQGEPTDAVLDVTAIYVANTSPLDLVDDQLAEATTTIRNTYKQRLPFEVHLKMQGELMKPLITFDIILPERNYNVSNDIVQNVEVKLEQLRQEPSELNKQVFALLLLNRFVGENPFNNSASSPFSAGAFARQSASKLLTEQLNRLAENLIQGVDLNFDVVSIDDYTTGERRNKTDFNVSLSKNLLSERLTVTVGSNFELEGPQQSQQQGSNIAGDVALDYKLSKDGRYMLRGYRKNEYQGVVEGYVIETGLSFIITVDYNKFAEIFRRKKMKNSNAKPVDKPATPPPATQSNGQEPGNEPFNEY
ncbi:MAG TPA: translocation/assembly module TamB domain-containing protein [Chitinophagaceae bacterium]|nr:translocation/assembly module TamB domain-containing protein [Chitinophagaceae bacterium]